MRRTLILLTDLVLIMGSTLLALALRDNLELGLTAVQALMPFLAVTVLVSVPILWGFGLPRSIWRLSHVTDYFRVLGAIAAIVVAATAGTFIVNRLDGVSRSIPVLQGIDMVILMIGARVAARLHHQSRHPVADVVPLARIGDIPTDRPSYATVLIVGLNSLTELYLRALTEFGREQVRVAGILGRNERQTGRQVMQVPVLGQPEDLEAVIGELKVHGVTISRVVVVMPSERLSPAVNAALESVRRRDGIQVFRFTEHLGLEGEGPWSAASAASVRPSDGGQLGAFRTEPVAASLQRGYWTVKRGLDAVAASCLLLAAAPLLLVGALLAAADVGLPVMFWQQRPGLGGRPFRLYKVRTMAAAVDGDGNPIPDRDRLSPMGDVLRRTRLDELPQIWSILRGEMSFIGPRPLLPVDQGSAYAARLMVRPGLTGWAQVKGGRDISPADKAALDVWYILNASFWLDVQIAVETVRMVILGERIDRAAIDRAWRDLRAQGVAAAA